MIEKENSAANYLFKSDNIWMFQWSMIHDLSLHMFINLDRYKQTE